MRMYDLILKKRNGQPLTESEINFFIQSYSQGTIPDYQASAMLMATYFSGMDDTEIFALTKAMIESGDTIDLSAIHGVKVDKHSTGGVGDKTTIALAPLVAAAGIPVAKLSGRGLGHTGGTLDKLESFKGFSYELSEEQFMESVNTVGVAIAGQTANLCPADKKLYALRDVTATIESIPFIVGSIMSKKLSSGSDAIVLDVKTGSGAFMKSVDEAFELAEKLVDVGERMGKRIVAVVPDMSQPLGHTIGNSLEVQEAIETLKGKGPQDLQDLVIHLGGHMLALGNAAENFEDGMEKISQLIDSRAGVGKLKELVANQGGNPDWVDDYGLWPQAQKTLEIKAEKSGYIKEITAEKMGTASMKLGAGRETKESVIDLTAGIELVKKTGEKIEQGEAIAILHAADENLFPASIKSVNAAFEISEQPVSPPRLIYGTVDRDGMQEFD